MIENEPIQNMLLQEISSTVSRLAAAQNQNLWRTPLLGIASASDSLFEKLSQAIDPTHAMPEDLLPGAQSVLVFFLPFEERLGKENDSAGFHAARSWAQAYVTTNELIKEICERLKVFIETSGYSACVTPATHNFDETKLISRWSHKHLAYIAGLGTFGHHRLLITPSGCCGRLGSLVTTMPIPPTPRPEKEFCLVKTGYECLACVAKCTYEALSETAFDRHRCYKQLLVNDAYHGDLPLVDVCGKCACEVPCSYCAPVA